VKSLRDSRKDVGLDDIGQQEKTYEAVPNEKNQDCSKKTGMAKQPAHGYETLYARLESNQRSKAQEADEVYVIKVMFCISPFPCESRLQIIRNVLPYNGILPNLLAKESKGFIEFFSQNQDVLNFG
jgi:hypothetical protein